MTILPLMFSLSQGVGYAVKALVCMEGRDCATQYTRAIAACSGVPASYLPKIFKKLAAGGVIEAKRGRSGGTRLARIPERISLLEIAEAVEGKDFLPDCLLGEAYCRDGTACPCRDFWPRERERIRRELGRISLARMIAMERSQANPPPLGRTSARPNRLPIPIS
ncbi:MAG: Rrf2 family transcriptional regulator [Puniceicoccaceae bacterium]|nr:MAG: Rrf2 family transcriptional regulator [Puniceicoccaceae bacterium]